MGSEGCPVYEPVIVCTTFIDNLISWRCYDFFFAVIFFIEN